MKGICKTDNALYVGRFLDGATVSIGLNRQQRWQFETTSDGRVKKKKVSGYEIVSATMCVVAKGNTNGE